MSDQVHESPDAPPVAQPASRGRRRFLSRMGMLGAAAAGTGMLGVGQSADAALRTSFQIQDPDRRYKRRRVELTDILNFALNLEYLEAEFYLIAAYGRRLADELTTGKGQRGEVVGGRKINFSDPVVASFAKELAMDEEAHVKLLRSALGNKAVARPRIDLQDSFTAAAVAAGVIPAGQTFDPYANDTNFLLASFIFEDVGVTAYNGAVPFIADEGVLQVAASVLAVEAYHSGGVRTLLTQQAQSNPAIYDIVRQISDLRDLADGTGNRDVPLRDENPELSNIAAASDQGLAPYRTFQQVLNIVYLAPGAPDGGGFFPNRVNGLIR